MTYIFIFIGLAILFLLYSRYMPVAGVRCKSLKAIMQEPAKVVVDLRDYNVSSRSPLNGTINIPVAYIKRHYHDIPNKQVHVVATDRIEKNMGIRLLRKEGIQVVSYSLEGCPCGKNLVSLGG
ncbi:sulfurtransferase [Bacillus testis]|uniref:sulfurtransferase n=1 Tax=Bacillus testis TaxID=1622072 RepID=UPI000841003C|nr:sulfurtransferase [Bacillus testis]